LRAIGVSYLKATNSYGIDVAYSRMSEKMKQDGTEHFLLEITDRDHPRVNHCKHDFGPARGERSAAARKILADTFGAAFKWYGPRKTLTIRRMRVTS
jgi:hypothetical protein